MPDLIAWLREQLDQDQDDIETSRLSDSPDAWWLPDLVTRTRLLADIAAKREILAWIGDHEFNRAGSDWGILCALVKPYADRPGFDPNWRTG